MEQKIKFAIVLCALLTGLGHVLCEDIDQGLTAPAAPEVNNGLAQTFDSQNIESQSGAVKAELRHHPGPDSEHYDFGHSSSITPSPPIEYQPSESWPESQSDGFSTNQFQQFPTISQPINSAPPLYKAGN